MKSSASHLQQEFALLKKNAITLPLYDNPDYYDLAYPGQEGDVDFYADRAMRAKKVLYLGIGTGRIFSKILRKNKKAHIYGIDYSKAMIRHFKKSYTRFSKNVHCKNVLNGHNFPPAYFDVVLAPHSFFTHFNKKQLHLALSNCRKWLKDSGQFLTDNFSPFKNSPEALERYQEVSSPKVKVITFICYNHNRQYLTEYNFITTAHKKKYVARIKLRYYYPQQFAEILQRAGFKNISQYGDFSLRSVSKKAKYLLYIAEKR